jgi:arylsulfatase A-like enzyme
MAAAVTAFSADKPNIIFILADDLAMGDIGAYGQTLIKTPNLDRMAQGGTRYLSAYAGTSVCAPSRSSLMTGLHMGHCPIRANREIKPEGQKPLPPNTVTIASLLKQAGYATACMGKWGMGMFDTSGSPFAVGFDHFYGYNCQRHAHSYFPTYLYDNQTRFTLPGNDKQAKVSYAGNYIQKDVLTWVRSQKKQPFFLFYAAVLPHGSYEIDDISAYDDQPWSEQEKIYAAMVSRLDKDVGELMDTLVDMGIDKNTLIMFSGDNGSSFSTDSPLAKRFAQSLGMRGHKRSMYEGGLKQGALAWWPGTVPAGRVTDEPWAFWDILPTAVELAGATTPDGFKGDGHSLVSFLKGGPAPHRTCFYWELHEGGGSKQAVRFGQWKAVKNGPQENIELYNVQQDPGESRDMAAQQAEEVKRAEALLKQERFDDPEWPLVQAKKKK